LRTNVGWLNRSRNSTKHQNPKPRSSENNIWENQTVSLNYGVPSNPINHTNTQTMIKTDKIRKPQPAVFYIIDYLWSGFAGLSVAMVVVALWAWGSAVFGEFMLPAPVEVFQKSFDLLKHFQENEIGCGGHFGCAGGGIGGGAGGGQF